MATTSTPSTLITKVSGKTGSGRASASPRSTGTSGWGNGKTTPIKASASTILPSASTASTFPNISISKDISSTPSTGTACASHISARCRRRMSAEPLNSKSPSSSSSRRKEPRCSILIILPTMPPPGSTAIRSALIIISRTVLPVPSRLGTSSSTAISRKATCLPCSTWSRCPHK